MTNDIRVAGLRQEWATLQATFERYERGGLTVKLVAVVLVAAGLLTSFAPVLICVLLAVLWLQEGIWRSFQARIGARLLKVEAGLRHEAESAASADRVAAPGDVVAFQLHSEWLASRAGGFRLLRDFIANSLRPTVAYPYVVLMVGVVVWVFLQGQGAE